MPAPMTNLQCIKYILSLLVASSFCGAMLPPPSVPVRDVVILGSGPAGCTAAIYSARALLKPLVVAGYIPGGQLTLTSDVENFPGYPEPVSGPKLVEDLATQAKKFGAEFWNVDCNSIDTSCHPFKLHLPNGTVHTRSIILATGAESIWLGAQNEDDYKGTGISTCATCDGYLFRDKDVVVVGGGDSAMEEAEFLSRFAKTVCVVHRRSSFDKASQVDFMTASPIALDVYAVGDAETCEGEPQDSSHDELQSKQVARHRQHAAWSRTEKYSGLHSHQGVLYRMSSKSSGCLTCWDVCVVRFPVAELLLQSGTSPKQNSWMEVK
jgi:thioredoxin reductase